MATGTFEKNDYGALAPKVATKISHEQIRARSEIFHLFEDKSEELIEAGLGHVLVPFIRSGQMVAEDLAVTAGKITNQAQKLTVLEQKLEANKTAHIHWNLERRMEKHASDDYKVAVLVEAMSSAVTKLDNDLLSFLLAGTGNSAEVKSVAPSDATKVSFIDILNARKFVKDEGKMPHGMGESFLVGRTEMFNRLVQFKDFTATSGVDQNPINGLVGRIAGFNFVEISNTTLPEDTLLVLSKKSGFIGLDGAEYKPAQKNTLSTEVVYEWLQDYGFLLNGNGFRVGKIKYNFGGTTATGGTTA